MDKALPGEGSPTPPVLYLGTSNGIRIFQNDAQTGWKALAHSLAGHDISALAWDVRTPGVLLAGTAAGNLFISSDSGFSWEPAGISFPGRKVWTIAPDLHRNSGAFYLGVDGGHLFYTPDTAKSCEELLSFRALPGSSYWFGPFGPAIFHSIIPVESSPGQIYLGLSVVGVFISNNDGLDWQDTTANIPRVPHELPEGPDLADIHKLAVHPLNPARLYATTHYGTFRSDDGAKSWENITSGLPFEMTRPLALHPDDPETVYVIAHEDSDDALPLIRGPLQVHRSRDGGRHWQPLGSGLPQQANCSVLREAFISHAGEDCHLYLGTNKGQVFASYDEGENWQSIAQVDSSVRVVRVSN
ncbi:MAG: hypothetical protein J0I20_14265 [Chloroflexi bacterium]|nr:hypothetical protein [Chloroflexota bacterium]OJW02676.1 MAG: hypothetical protein BGO39_05415 [Chloroflexi bacterium 54-19]